MKKHVYVCTEHTPLTGTDQVNLYNSYLEEPQTHGMERVNLELRSGVEYKNDNEIIISSSYGRSRKHGGHLVEWLRKTDCGGTGGSV